MATTTTTPDPLLESQIFWLRYKREIAIALAIVFAAIIGFGIYKLMEQRRAEAAAAALGLSKSVEDYRRVATDYPNEPAARSAMLFAADELRKKGDFAGANAQLEQFVNKFPNDAMAVTARLGMAANLESLGKPDEALSAYQKIATSYSKSYAAPLAMIAQVHLLQQKGQTEEARKICENVISQYRDNYISSEAMRLYRTLMPKTPPAPAAAASATPAMQLAVPPPPAKP